MQSSSRNRRAVSSGPGIAVQYSRISGGERIRGGVSARAPALAEPQAVARGFSHSRRLPASLRGRRLAAA